MDFVYDFEAKVNKYSEICEHRNIFIPPQRSGKGLIYPCPYVLKVFRSFVRASHFVIVFLFSQLLLLYLMQGFETCSDMH